jgi:flagellum-specific peptidoglycan hydrolase FlgJ
LKRLYYAGIYLGAGIRDWHQAYKEGTSGQIRTAEDFLYRWNGKLSSDSLKTFLKTFYNDNGHGSSSKSYIGDETAKTLNAAMDKLKLAEGTSQRALFVTAFGNELRAREANLKRELSPIEQYAVIQELSRQEVLSEKKYTVEIPAGEYTGAARTLEFTRDVVEMPGFLVRMAKQAGFTYNFDLKGFYRTAPDGRVEKFDPEKIYTPPAMRPSQAAASEPTPQPQPEKPQVPEAQQEETPKATGPRRMPDGREIGTKTRGKSVSASSPSKTGQAFLEEIKPDIIEVAKSIDIPPSVLAAQAILESGWGKSRIGNNIFGVKAGGSWTGATRAADTNEVEDGQTVRINATFRDYDSVADSIQDLGRVLNGSRYAAVRGTLDYAEAARALQAAGYATDPDYAAKLIKIIEDHKLYEMDEEA